MSDSSGKIKDLEKSPGPTFSFIRTKEIQDLGFILVNTFDGGERRQMRYGLNQR